MLFSSRRYDRLKHDMLYSRFYDAGSITQLKNAYKQGFAYVLYKFCKRYNRTHILSDIVRQDWLQIAHNSIVFSVGEHSVDCIMQELKQQDNIKLSGHIDNSFKKALNTWQKGAIRESFTIKEGYKKIARYDSIRFNPDYEHKKIKRAIRFICLGISTYYVNKLPTHLTIDEYNALHVANAHNAEDRYRFDIELNCYSRIGRKTFKPAVILFGHSGAKILFEKKIARFDKHYCGIFGKT